jgi:hypothetical protein
MNLGPVSRKKVFWDSPGTRGMGSKFKSLCIFESEKLMYGSIVRIRELFLVLRNAFREGGDLMTEPYTAKGICRVLHYERGGGV